MALRSRLGDSDAANDDVSLPVFCFNSCIIFHAGDTPEFFIYTPVKVIYLDFNVVVFFGTNNASVNILVKKHPVLYLYL